MSDLNYNVSVNVDGSEDVAKLKDDLDQIGDVSGEATVTVDTEGADGAIEDLGEVEDATEDVGEAGRKSGVGRSLRTAGQATHQVRWPRRRWPRRPWQSEFLAVAAIVVLTIFLREHGSPESKPVHAPHAETGS